MTECAVEGGVCTCDSGYTVYYGAESDPNTLDQTQNYGSITSTGSVNCEVSSFGEDPLFGVVKKCFCANFPMNWQMVMTEPFTVTRACGETPNLDEEAISYSERIKATDTPT